MLNSDIRPDDLPQVDGYCCGHAYLKLSDFSGCVCLCSQCREMNCAGSKALFEQALANGQAAQQPPINKRLLPNNESEPDSEAEAAAEMKQKQVVMTPTASTRTVGTSTCITDEQVQNFSHNHRHNS